MENCNSYANVCRVCLKRDIQIYSIKNTYLEDVYEKITSIELNSTCTQSLCYICVKRLKQCHKLIEQAVETDKLLKYALWCGVEIDNIERVQTFTLSVSPITTINIPLHPVENDIKEESAEIKEELKDNWDYGIHAVSDQIEEDQIDQKISTGSKETYSIDGLRAYEDVKDKLDSNDDVPTLSVLLSISSINISLDSLENAIKEESAKIKEELNHNWDNGINAVSGQIEEDQIDQENSTGSKETYSIDGLRAYEDFKDISDSEDNGPLKNISLKIHSETKQDSVNNKKFRKFNETLTLNETKPANNINLELPKTSKIQINDNKHDSNFLVPNNKYICNICNYETVNKKHLIVHLRLHDTKEQIHCCSQCQYMTVNRSNFNRHLKKHTGEKPYECHICQRKFSHITSLNIHKRTHTGEKPYECLLCPKKYRHKCSLNYHLRTRHTEIKQTVA